jgi:hypothetical protein
VRRTRTRTVPWGFVGWYHNYATTGDMGGRDGRCSFFGSSYGDDDDRRPTDRPLCIRRSPLGYSSRPSSSSSTSPWSVTLAPPARLIRAHHERQWWLRSAHPGQHPHTHPHTHPSGPRPHADSGFYSPRRHVDWDHFYQKKPIRTRRPPST